ncbi:MAG: imidazolonepropionase [Thermoplasmata archaeon]|nr:imidazolonepropionase [Thermoplasmata archaeon]
MTDVDLVITASRLVTPKGPAPLTGDRLRDLRVVGDALVAVDDGVIVDAGERDAIERRYGALARLDLPGQAIVPGFVDPHTHALFVGSRADEVVLRQEGRSYMEVLTAGGGILRTVRAVRAASDGELIMETLERLDRMLAHGTTTAEVKTGYYLQPEGELRLLEVIGSLDHPVDIVPTFMGAHAVPPEFEGNAPGYIDSLLGVIPRAAAMASFCDVFCEAGAFDLEQSRRVLEAARSVGMGLKVHADEIEPLGGAGLAAELRARSAEHLLAASEEDLKAMAREGVVAVLLPATSYVLMKGRYADARRMIELGLPVALATDLNPNCWCESMQTVISLAVYKMRMHPDEALAAATLNAAHAIDMADDVGSIEVGKRADIVAIDAPDHFHIPYRLGGNIVTHVIKGGDIVVDRRMAPCF